MCLLCLSQSISSSHTHTPSQMSGQTYSCKGEWHLVWGIGGRWSSSRNQHHIGMRNRGGNISGRTWREGIVCDTMTFCRTLPEASVFVCLHHSLSAFLCHSLGMTARNDGRRWGLFLAGCEAQIERELDGDNEKNIEIMI